MKERILEYNCIKLWCDHCLSSLCSSGLSGLRSLKDTETGDEDDGDMEKHPLAEKQAKNYTNR